MKIAGLPKAKRPVVKHTAVKDNVQNPVKGKKSISKISKQKGKTENALLMQIAKQAAIKVQERESSRLAVMDRKEKYILQQVEAKKARREAREAKKKEVKKMIEAKFKDKK